MSWSSCAQNNLLFGNYTSPWKNSACGNHLILDYVCSCKLTCEQFESAYGSVSDSAFAFIISLMATVTAQQEQIVVQQGQIVAQQKQIEALTVQVKLLQDRLD